MIFKEETDFNMSDNTIYNDIIRSLAEEYSALYFMDIETNRTIAYRMDKFARETYGVHFLKGNRNFFDVINEEYIDNYVHPDDIKNLKENCTQEHIYSELSHNKSCSMYYRVKRGDEEYHHYKLHILKVGDKDSKPKSFIMGFINRDNQVMQERQLRLAAEREAILKDKAEKLSEDAYIDVLTGLFNRRAYEVDTISAINSEMPEDSVFITADVNGLKTVNDNMGHEAGDELIKGVSLCLSECFGKYGKIYRVGGDEFFAVIFMNQSELPKAQSHFQNMVKNWSGNIVKELSVSVGYASKAEFPDAAPAELSKTADKRMYQDKSKYYSKKGLDRRGCHDAFKILCSSYIMILKIELNTDSYWLLSTSLPGADSVPYNLSECFELFSDENIIHKDDFENFRKYINIDYISSYFKQGNKIFKFFYRRKLHNTYRKMLLEIQRTSEYSHENQQLYLFIKDVND